MQHVTVGNVASSGPNPLDINNPAVTIYQYSVNANDGALNYQGITSVLGSYTSNTCAANISTLGRSLLLGAQCGSSNFALNYTVNSLPVDLSTFDYQVVPMAIATK